MRLPAFLLRLFRPAPAAEFHAWFKARVRIFPSARTPRLALYADYSDWVNDRGGKPERLAQFGVFLQQHAVRVTGAPLPHLRHYGAKLKTDPADLRRAEIIDLSPVRRLRGTGHSARHLRSW